MRDLGGARAVGSGRPCRRRRPAARCRRRPQWRRDPGCLRDARRGSGPRTRSARALRHACCHVESARFIALSVAQVQRAACCRISSHPESSHDPQHDRLRAARTPGPWGTSPASCARSTIAISSWRSACPRSCVRSRPTLRQALSRGLRRGKVDCALYLRASRTPPPSRWRSTGALVEQLMRTAREVAIARAAASRRSTPMDMLRWPGVVREADATREPAGRGAATCCRKRCSDLGRRRARAKARACTSCSRPAAQALRADRAAGARAAARDPARASASAWSIASRSSAARSITTGSSRRLVLLAYKTGCRRRARPARRSRRRDALHDRWTRRSPPAAASTS